MATELSRAAERYIAEALSGGAYASRSEVLEAAVAALRERRGEFDSFGTVELSPEECDRIQREALGKSNDAKPNGYTIPERS